MLTPQGGLERPRVLAPTELGQTLRARIPAGEVNGAVAAYVVHPNVRLGADAVIGEYVIVGVPPRGLAPGELETVIGPRMRIRSHSVIYAGNRIGADFQTGHGAMVRELNEIGDDVSVGSHSIIEHHTRIGNGVRIHSNAFVPEYSILEDGAWIGPHAVLTNARYPASPSAKGGLRGPHVMAEARVGANATILPGVVIGRQALVGAGAVVVRDVPAGKVVAGNPARVINDVARLPAYRIDQLTGQGDEASICRS